MSHGGGVPTALNPAGIGLTLLSNGGSTCVHDPEKGWSNTSLLEVLSLGPHPQYPQALMSVPSCLGPPAPALCP